MLTIIRVGRSEKYFILVFLFNQMIINGANVRNMARFYYIVKEKKMNVLTLYILKFCKSDSFETSHQHL